MDFLSTREKTKALQKFITDTYNLIFCHYFGVSDTWVEIISINVNKFWHESLIIPLALWKFLLLQFWCWRKKILGRISFLQFCSCWLILGQCLLSSPQKFSDVFRRYRMGTWEGAWSGLIVKQNHVDDLLILEYFLVI